MDKPMKPGGIYRLEMRERPKVPHAALRDFLAMTPETTYDWYAIRERRDAWEAYEDMMERIAAGYIIEVEHDGP